MVDKKTGRAGQMNRISKSAYRKLVLLYLIGNFERGIWGNYKFQKTLYYGLKDLPHKPFRFEHTSDGMFSQQAWDEIDGLLAAGIVKDANPADNTKNYVISEDFDPSELFAALENSDEELTSSLKKSVTKFQRMPWAALKWLVVERDPILKEVPLGGVIFDDELPGKPLIALSDDDCEDLELALQPVFIEAMSALVHGIESGEMDFGDGFTKAHV